MSGRRGVKAAPTSDDPNVVRVRAFCTRMARFGRSLFRARVGVGPMAMNAATFAVLEELDRHGPTMMTDLATHLGVDQSAASRQVRGAEALGLVSRTGDAHDGRVSHFSLTPKGRRAYERSLRAVLEVYTSAMSDWTDAERAKLADLMDRLWLGLTQEGGRREDDRSQGYLEG